MCIGVGGGGHCALPPQKKKKKKSKPEIRAKCGGKSGKKWSEKIKEELHSRFNLIQKKE